MSEEKKGFFRRLREGLTKTRNNIVAGIDSIFSGFSSIDDDFYEEIEEIFVMGDIGINTTTSIIEHLKEEVEENVLQEALDQTIEKYPVFLSVMRKGLFWHYLEKSELRPIVRKEYKEPCSSLYVRDKKTLLFEVTYYKKRINFEVFHALTDGTGATEYLRELVKNYLQLVHKDELERVELSDQYLTVKDQEDDSFSRYYDPDFPRKKKKKIKAFQI